MREAGFTYRQIGAKLDVPWGTIRSRCQSLGITPQIKVVHERNRPLKHHHPRWLLEMMYWDCELSTVDIGYELDISYNEVLRMMARFNIPRRTRTQAQELMWRNGHRNPPTRLWTAEEAYAASKKSADMRARKVRERERHRRRRAKVS